MYLRFLLSALPAIGVRAFAPAPIRWRRLFAQRFVLNPTTLPNSVLVVDRVERGLQKLVVRDHASRAWRRQFVTRIPQFTAKLDNTIRWDDTGHCIEASGENNGDAVHMAPCTGASNQLWTVVPWQHGDMNYVNLQDTDMCLDLVNTSDSKSALIELRTCADKLTEAWTMKEVMPNPTQGSSQFDASSSFIRQVMCSLGVMAGIAALGVAWLRRWQARAPHVAFACQSSMRQNVDQGAICLIASSADCEGGLAFNYMIPTSTGAALQENGIRRHGHAKMMIEGMQDNEHMLLPSEQMLRQLPSVTLPECREDSQDGLDFNVVAPASMGAALQENRRRRQGHAKMMSEDTQDDENMLQKLSPVPLPDFTEDLQDDLALSIGRKPKRKARQAKMITDDTQEDEKSLPSLKYDGGIKVTRLPDSMDADLEEKGRRQAYTKMMSDDEQSDKKTLPSAHRVSSMAVPQECRRAAMDAAPPVVVVIAGPTGVGKSDAAMVYAETLDCHAEIVSADSVQVYRGLSIGSNQPTQADQERCAHHLVGYMEPSETGTVGDWTSDALRIIDELHGRQAMPIVCGGSMMYLDWLVHGERDAGKSDPEVRAKVLEELRPYEDDQDWENALALLVELNPEKAERIPRNNWRQLARALEVEQMQEHEQRGRGSRARYDMRCFFLSPQDRSALFHRIDARCAKMLQRGLLEEVVGLLESGDLSPDTQAGLAIGYRQVIEYLVRPDPKERDVEALKVFLRTFGTASRNYAHKQLQWFMRDPAFTWVLANPADPSAVASEIARLVALPREAFDELSRDTANREAQVVQGQAMGQFASCIEQVEEVTLNALLELADTCTRRVPVALRKVVDRVPMLLELQSNCAVPFGKLYWHGRHRRWGWGPPLGKLHKQGVQLAEAFGWQCVKEDDESAIPVFYWSARKSADFPAFAEAGEPLPLIRPFPQDFTRRLDDKAELAAHLVAAGHADVHPPTWTADDFLCSGPVREEGEHEMWYLKHSHGVKGNAVHLFSSASCVEQRLVELGDKGRRNFVVQRGVAPPHLRNGRKWVLRVHTLLRGLSDGGLAAYCHRDMVCLEYPQVYTPNVKVRGAHISSAGNQKNWPKPYLLEDEAISRQVFQLSAKCFAAVWPHVPRGPYTPLDAQLCHVFGSDIVVDEGGRAWLLEVNNYPAIASGTMDHVDSGVYTTLIRDLFKLVVLPLTDGAAETPGGFVQLDVESVLDAPTSASAAPDAS